MNVSDGVRKPVIEAEFFSFSYPAAQRPAAHDVTFAVLQNEIFGFLGPSGAGKSTTQNLLIGLLGGYRGRVNVLGKDVQAWDWSSYGRIGVAFEAPNHYCV